MIPLCKTFVKKKKKHQRRNVTLSAFHYHIFIVIILFILEIKSDTTEVQTDNLYQPVSNQTDFV